MLAPAEDEGYIRAPGGAGTAPWSPLRPRDPSAGAGQAVSSPHCALAKRVGVSCLHTSCRSKLTAQTRCWEVTHISPYCRDKFQLCSQTARQCPQDRKFKIWFPTGLRPPAPPDTHLDQPPEGNVRFPGCAHRSAVGTRAAAAPALGDFHGRLQGASESEGREETRRSSLPHPKH